MDRSGRSECITIDHSRYTTFYNVVSILVQFVVFGLLLTIFYITFFKLLRLALKFCKGTAFISNTERHCFLVRVCMYPQIYIYIKNLTFLKIECKGSGLIAVSQYHTHNSVSCRVTKFIPTKQNCVLEYKKSTRIPFEIECKGTAFLRNTNPTSC